MNRTHKNRRAGFTLIEIMVVVVILGILAAVAVKVFAGRQGEAEVKLTRVAMDNVVGAIDFFQMDHSRYPNSIDELINKPGDVDQAKWPALGYVKHLPVDSWGRPFLYRTPGLNSKPYDLMSLGADGKEGGEGNFADIDYWVKK